MTTQAVLAIEQVKTHSKITLSKKYVNINQYIISRYEVFANLFINNVRLQCKRKLSQLIALFGSSQLNIQYVVLGPRKSPMPLVRVLSENDKIFRQEKKYV